MQESMTATQTRLQTLLSQCKADLVPEPVKKPIKRPATEPTIKPAKRPATEPASQAVIPSHLWRGRDIERWWAENMGNEEDQMEQYWLAYLQKHGRLPDRRDKSHPWADWSNP